MPRTCWECRLIYFDTADAGYSEMTPGSDASLFCRKDHWILDAFRDDTEDLRRKIFTAEQCPDYEQYEPDP